MKSHRKFASRFSDAERAALLDNAQKSIWLQEGQPGLSYLMSKRGLSEKVIKKFGLGYVPVNIRHQLAGRIIFPLYDASGNLIALMSRFIGEGDTFLPHYWHEQYEKSFHLYGIDKAKDAIRRWRFAVVVEGQIDTIQFHNHNVSNVVGLCCTNMSLMQLAIIYRYCDEIVLVLDNDTNRAGQAGVDKIMRYTRIKNFTTPDSFGEMEFSALGNGYKISPVSMPVDTDPDEFIKEFGINEMKDKIRKVLLNMRGKKCQLISALSRR